MHVSRRITSWTLPFLAIIRPKALGRDDPEGTANAKREPKALDVKSTGVFWRESIIVNNINNNKSWCRCDAEFYSGLGLIIQAIRALNRIN